MALGEAFVDVRANLKPFSKDLEKGLKVILAAAERKLKAESQFGRGLADNLKNHVKEGMDEGVDEGFQSGSKKAIKRGLNDFQKFFSVLGDFFDDGLSAVPSEVKAALVLGIVAASVALLPLLAGAISAAITAGAVTGAAAIGIILAARFRVVQQQFQAVGQSILRTLTGPASRLIDPLVGFGEKIDALFVRLAPNIDHIFQQISGALGPIGDTVIDFIDKIVKALQVMVRNARPIIDALGEALPQLADDIASAMVTLSLNSEDTALALKDLLAVIGYLIVATAGFINFLAKMYFWLRLTAAAVTGDWSTAQQLLANRAIEGERAAEGFDGSMQNLNTTLGMTQTEADAAARAINPLVSSLFKGMDASIDFHQAMDDLNKSIKDGNKDFRETTQKGRDNLRLVETAVTSIAKLRDQNLAYAIEHGQATDQIEANYQAQLTALEKTIAGTGHETTALQDLFNKAKEAPSEVNIAVKTPGLDAAILKLSQIPGLVKGAIAGANAAANAIRAGMAGGHGLQTNALGSIVTSPTMTLVGEAGYKEGIIPDPAVMPGRAMQLSNQLGLTDLIASHLGSPGVNVTVLVGGKQLENIIDYQVSLNNHRQSLAYAQGTVG